MGRDLVVYFSSPYEGEVAEILSEVEGRGQRGLCYMFYDFGRLAQLVEHGVHIAGVTGSSPVSSTSIIPSLLRRGLKGRFIKNLLVKK